jgi:hypothetical protein
MVKKIDLRKELKHLYAASAKKVDVVDVPSFPFVMLDGQIEAGKTPATSAAFQEAFQALYGAAYTLKFMSKLRAKNPLDFTLMALEGLWWVEDGEFDMTRPGDWKWRLMILQPQHITPALFRAAVDQLRAKRPSPSVERLRFAKFREGRCLQTMHLGPYATEPATIARMAAFAQENGFVRSGKHHEIYLSDPRRARPERIRTILRQPVRRVRAELRPGVT